MEEYIRVTAKTVEDAVTEASIQLGASRDNIEYRVIEKETKGFLGIGAKKAVIEAKKKKSDEDIINEVFGEKKKAPAPKKEFRSQEKEPRKFERDVKRAEREPKKERDSFKAEREAAKPERESKPQREAKPEREVRAEREGKPERETRPEREARPERETRRPDRERKPYNRNSWKENAEGKKEEAKKEEVKAENQEVSLAAAAEEDFLEEASSKTPKTPVDPKEAEERAENFLKSVFASMQMQVEIKAEFKDDTLSVDLSGEDMGVLIGKRGQTLDSLQYLVSLVVNKGKASYIRVKVDTENYRNRRKATLENLAKNIAYKVKKTRRPVYLEPMNPYERRIIHSALQNDPYVTTHSEGEEPCRKVVVTLKKRERGGYQNRISRMAETAAQETAPAQENAPEE